MQTDLPEPRSTQEGPAPGSEDLTPECKLFTACGQILRLPSSCGEPSPDFSWGAGDPAYSAPELKDQAQPGLSLARASLLCPEGHEHLRLPHKGLRASFLP